MELVLVLATPAEYVAAHVQQYKMGPEHKDISNYCHLPKALHYWQSSKWLLEETS